MRKKRRSVKNKSSQQVGRLDEVLAREGMKSGPPNSIPVREILRKMVSER